MAVHNLPKVEAWVQSPLPALLPADLVRRQSISALFADVAQLAEQGFRKAQAVGSNPTIGLPKGWGGPRVQSRESAFANTTFYL